ALHEERQLHHREAALVLRASLVELARRLVGAHPALFPGGEHRLVSAAKLLELGALGRHGGPRLGAEERRLELLLHLAVAPGDRIVVPHGGNELDRAHLLVAVAEGPVGRELEQLLVRLGQLPEGLAPPLLEGWQPPLVLSAGTLQLLFVALQGRAAVYLVTLLPRVSAQF